MPINWQEVLTSVLTTVGGGGVLLAAAAWLIKTVLTDRLAREAEEFKTQLKADADAQIERLKNSLEMAALEHQVRFSKLHERRAEVIAELYKRLVEVGAEGSLFVYTVGGSSGEHFEQYNKAYKNNWDLARFIEANRIYLPVRACDLLDKYVHTLNKAVIDVNIYGTIEFPNPKTIQEQTEVLRKAYIALHQRLGECREQQLRRLGGQSHDPPRRTTGKVGRLERTSWKKGYLLRQPNSTVKTTSS